MRRDTARETKGGAVAFLVMGVVEVAVGILWLSQGHGLSGGAFSCLGLVSLAASGMCFARLRGRIR